MNDRHYEEQLRVTSIPHSSAKWVIFSGVPLQKNSYKVNSGKYIVSVAINPNDLPVTPSRGQHWVIKGRRDVGEITTGDYIMQQHTYERPEFVECSLPDSGEQLIQFIAKEKDFVGIGESKARAIYQLLGKSFHSTLSKDKPEARELLRGVLSEPSIDALFEGYSKYKNLAYCNWMSEHKIPAPVQQRLIRHHGYDTIESIKKNPYLLISFGLKFSDVDKIIAKGQFTIELDDEKRLSAALQESIIKQVGKGHTYTSERDVRPYLLQLLNDKKLVTKAFSAGQSKAQYIINKELNTYHPTAQLLMEGVATKRLKLLAGRTDIFENAENEAYLAAVRDLPYGLTNKQIQAILSTLNNAVSCITGGAGTGKTTVLRTALKAYQALGFEIHAMALSGRAAMRLQESIGFKAFTIAKFLREEPIEQADGHQNRHLVVIDESSMIDLPTLYRIITHIHTSVRIIFSGDPDQLPPIGCGKVLADIVESGVIANTKLDIVKRQEGSTGIPEYSKLINQGVVPDSLSTGNIHFHETPKEDIEKVCCELYQLSPNNTRIMAPTKALVKDINKLVQNAVNPYGERLEFEMHGDMFFQNLKLNDAILFTQNQYDKGIQNGSLGTLSSITPVAGNYGEVTLDTGDKVEVNQAVLDCMELGYAITLHKAQGSQFPRIIIALKAGRIVDRSWLYTAITRAEIEVHIVGSSSVFTSVTETISSANRRNSYLATLLKQN